MKNSKIKTSVARICAPIFAAIAALTLLLPGLTTKAYANSGAPWSEGVDSMGVSTLYSWGVLEVESEN